MASPDPKERTAPAAEADLLGEEARNTGTLDKLADKGGTPTAGRSAQRGTPQQDGDARPGVDENQAGFVKDPDKKSSP